MELDGNISQFLGEKTNLRDDNWGGNISGRSKFLVTIISEIKKVVPESFIVGVRMSPEIKELGIYLNDSLKLEDGTEVQISKCPNDHGKIKSPLCCGQDMVCSA